MTRSDVGSTVDRVQTHTLTDNGDTNMTTHKLPTREINRDVTGPYRWVESSARVRVTAATKPVTGTQTVAWLFVLAVIVAIVCFAMDALAEPMPETMNVTCKDGTVAHEVVGNIDAPCRKHGGPAKVVPVGSASDNAPKVTDDDPEALHKVADCRDGDEYWSNKDSKHGACDGHGGVKAWSDGSAVKAKKHVFYRKAGAK